MSKNKLAYLTKDKCFAIETVFYVLLDIVLKNCHMEWHWLILDPLEGAGIQNIYLVLANEVDMQKTYCIPIN